MDAEQEAIRHLKPKGTYAELEDAIDRVAKMDHTQVSGAFAQIGAAFSRTLTDLGATIMRAIRFAGDIQAKVNEARAVGVTQEQIDQATKETQADGEGLIPKLDRLIEEATGAGKERVRRKVLGIPEEHEERAAKLVSNVPLGEFPVPEAIGRLIASGQLSDYSVSIQAPPTEPTAEEVVRNIKRARAKLATGGTIPAGGPLVPPLAHIPAPSFDQLVFGPYAVDTREGDTMETDARDDEQGAEESREALEADANRWRELVNTAPSLLFTFVSGGNTYRWDLASEHSGGEAWVADTQQAKARNAMLRALLMDALDRLNEAERPSGTRY